MIWEVKYQSKKQVKWIFSAEIQKGVKSYMYIFQTELTPFWLSTDNMNADDIPILEEATTGLFDDL